MYTILLIFTMFKYCSSLVTLNASMSVKERDKNRERSINQLQRMEDKLIYTFLLLIAWNTLYLISYLSLFVRRKTNIYRRRCLIRCWNRQARKKAESRMREQIPKRSRRKGEMSMAVLLFFLFGRPYKRGFFCNDESLSHPFHTSTVTSAMLYVVGLFLPVCAMLIGEFLYWRNCNAESRILFGYNVPLWAWGAYEKIGIFGFGAATTVLITDIAKYTIGRLRPHFMTLCVPNVNCSLVENQHKYIENYYCTENISSRLLKEIRLSFPSGHSSFSAYTMVYLALYLQIRLTWNDSKLFKLFLQLVCILMAWFTALSRISDYKHHWSDVLAGSLLGTTIAIVIAKHVADLFKPNEIEERMIESKNRCQDYETGAVGTQSELTALRSGKLCYGGIEENRAAR